MALALLVGVNVLTASGVSRPVATAVHLIAAAGAVAGARARGYTRRELGLELGRARSGLTLGAVVSAAAGLGVALLAALPPTRGSFSDPRFSDLAVADVVVEVAVRIPLVTALTEELLFRSVLLAVLLRRLSVASAVGVSSLLFGAWHLLTSSGSPVGDPDAVTSGLVAVAATIVAGIGFCLLRIRSGSVVAPFLVHATVNGTAFTAGVIVSSAG